MDRRSVVDKLAEALNCFKGATVTVKFAEDENKVQIKVVSDLFENMENITQNQPLKYRYN